MHQRYLNRIHHENRHPVHLSTTLDVYEDFKRYTEKSRKEEIPGKYLLIDGSDFSYQLNEADLTRIDEFIRR